MKRKEIKYGVSNVSKDGTTEILLPYDTPLKPQVRRKYAVRCGRYPVEDNIYGSNCYVYEDYDTETKVRYKKLYVNVPEIILNVMFSNDHRVCLKMRYDDENTDGRPLESYEDEKNNRAFPASKLTLQMPTYPASGKSRMRPLNCIKLWTFISRNFLSPG